MLLPVALAQAVLDQLVGGRGIGDAQQRLGQAHEHHALVGGQVVLAQEGVHAAGRHPLGAHRAHQLLGSFAHARSRRVVELGQRQQRVEAGRLVGEPQLADARAQRLRTPAAGGGR